MAFGSRAIEAVKLSEIKGGCVVLVSRSYGNHERNLKFEYKIVPRHMNHRLINGLRNVHRIKGIRIPGPRARVCDFFTVPSDEVQIICEKAGEHAKFFGIMRGGLRVFPFRLIITERCYIK